MKFYIAAHDKELAQDQAKELISLGFEVTSKWHSKEFLATGSHSLAERFEIAIEDLNDIKRADCLLLLSGPDKYSGGKFVEAGIAYGLGKPVYFKGHRENMLCHLFEEWGAA